MSELRLEDVETFVDGPAGLDLLRQFLAIPNVVGVFPGYKTVTGHKTKHVALVIHVRRKQPLEDLPIEARIPRFMVFAATNGSSEHQRIPTDVVEVGENKPQSVDVAQFRQRSDGPAPMVGKLRPSPGAVPIQAQPNTSPSVLTGTLSTAALVAGRFQVLASNHVTSWNGTGNKVYQPNIYLPDTEIACVIAFEPVLPEALNEYDVAYCATSTELVSTQIYNPSGKPFEPNAVGKAVRDEVVHLVVGNSGYVAESTVESTCYAINYEWIPGIWVTFVRLVLLAGNVTRAGDSGTPYLRAARLGGPATLLGLHMGANDTHSFGCAIPPNVTLPSAID